MKTEYIFFGVLGVIVLYALSRIKAPEVQQVPEFIGADTVQAPQSSAARDEARAGAFGALASVATAQTQSNLAHYTTDAQLKATEIASGLQERLGLAGFQSEERRAIAGYESAERQQAQQLEAAERMQAAGIGAETTRYLSGLDLQRKLYEADLSNRLAAQAQQIAAINQAAYGFRNQSLERQGTIFNALSSAWGGGSVYDYQTAFGGPRGSGIGSQIVNGLFGLGNRALGFFGI